MYIYVSKRQCIVYVCVCMKDNFFVRIPREMDRRQPLSLARRFLHNVYRYNMDTTIIIKFLNLLRPITFSVVKKNIFEKKTITIIVHAALTQNTFRRQKPGHGCGVHTTEHPSGIDFSSDHNTTTMRYRTRLAGRVLALEIVLLHRYAGRPVGELTDLQAHLRERMALAVRVAPSPVVLHPDRQLFRRLQHVHHQPRFPRHPVTAVVVQPWYAHVLVFTWRNPVID